MAGPTTPPFSLETLRLPTRPLGRPFFCPSQISFCTIRHLVLLLTITSLEGFTRQNSLSDSLYLESEQPSTLSSRLVSTIYTRGGYQDATTTFSYKPTAVVPGAIAGAGLPSLIVAGGGLLTWWSRKRRAAEP
jgi:hypothetical protein